MERISGTPVNTSYLALYLAVGTLVWHYLSVVFEAVSSMISWERWEGTIEYTFMKRSGKLKGSGSVLTCGAMSGIMPARTCPPGELSLPEKHLETI